MVGRENRVRFKKLWDTRGERDRPKGNMRIQRLSYLMGGNNRK